MSESEASDGNFTITHDDLDDILIFQKQILNAFRAAFSVVFVATLIGLVANVLVLVIILRDQKLRNTVYNVYVCSLCLSSTLFLLVWGVTDIVSYGRYLSTDQLFIHRDSALRKVLAGAETSTMVINCYMITALAIDRYFIIAHPVARQTWRTVRTALIACGVVWAAGVLSICVAIPVDLYTSLRVLYTITVIFFVLVYIIPVTIIAVCFVLTLRAAAAKRTSPALTSNGRRNLERQMRFLVLIGCVSISFIICWGYWHGYFLAIWPLIMSGRFYRLNIMVHISLHMLTDIMVIVNAALNPFLYALARPNIRQHVVNFFTCGRQSKQSGPEYDEHREVESTESCSEVSITDAVMSLSAVNEDLNGEVN